GAHQAALSAGAIGVVEKTAGADFIDRLAETLVDRTAGDDASIDVRVGPVPVTAARVWIANTKLILAALQEHDEVLEQPVPRDVLDLFCSYLDRWEDVAAGDGDFTWVARAAPADVERLVTWWGVIDAMSDEQLARLGVAWSPPEGEVFFRALVAGVLDAVGRHHE